MPVISRFVRSVSLLVAALACAPVPARADILPPSASACSGKEVGAACELMGRPGHCREESCSRATPDGMVSYACTLCAEDPAAPTEPAPEPAAPASPTATGKSACAGGPDGALVALAGLLGVLALRRRATRIGAPVGAPVGGR